MVCDTPDASPNLQQGFLDAKFLPIEEAIQTVTYSQDRSLLTFSLSKV